MYHTFECGHRVGVEVWPGLVAGKKKAALGVVDDMVHLVGLKFMQHGDGYCSISQRCQESHSPIGTVAPAKGYLITRLDASLLKEDV